MPLVELQDGKFVVIDLPYRYRDHIRSVPGARYKDGEWKVPASWVSAKILQSTLDDLDWDEAAQKFLWRLSEEYVQPLRQTREWALDPSVRLAGADEAYPYQTTGIRFLYDSGGCILADEMGCGKTLQAIGVLSSPSLIVAPKSAKAGWARELERWAPELTVVSVGGTAAQRRRALEQDSDIFLIHWEALALHSRIAGYGSMNVPEADRIPKELNRPWAVVVADEAHRACNPKTKQTRALWAIGQTAKRRYCLTGTPIKNSPDDLWSLLHFIASDEWPSRVKYLDRYADIQWNQWGGLEVHGLKPANQEEFHSLVDLRFLRRTKELVLPWLPEKVYERRDVEMSPKQARAYKSFKERMVAELDGGMGMALSPLTLAGRLSQMASAFGEITSEGNLRLCAPSSKVDELVELLAELGDEPLVVFAQSRQLIDLAATRLTAEGISCSMIVGGQSEDERTKAERDFMDGRVRVILLTMGAGSEALSLTRASYTCFLQRSWSLVQNLQAENRTHRPGQEQKVVIVDLVTPGTIEEAQQEAIRAKGERLEEIVQDRRLLLA